MTYERVDIVSDSVISELTELFREGSRIDDPVGMLSHFARWFGRKRRAAFFVSVSRRGMKPGEYKVTRRIADADRDGNMRKPVNPWRDWDSLETHTGGIVGQIITGDGPQMLTGLRGADDPILGADLAGMRSAMAIPTYDNGEPLNWAISFFREDMPRDIDFIRSAMLDINMLGMATRNLVSRKRAEDLKDEVTRQLERIAGIQRSLLPQRIPRIPGLDIGVSYLTSNEAGGDYYDFFPFPGGRWGILIADVAGHGAPAATVMAMLRGILHCYEREDFSPAAVMDFANAKLLDANLFGTFVTAFFAVIDPRTGIIEFARCGHNPPRIRRVGGDVVELDGDAGFPLGIDADLGVHTAAVRLDMGDTLVLYTDGITEAFSPGREMFGVLRLDAALMACSGKPECAVDSIHRALYSHTGVMDRDDDQTLVIIQRVHEPVPAHAEAALPAGSHA